MKEKEFKMDNEELNKRFETWYKEEALEYIPEDLSESEKNTLKVLFKIAWQNGAYCAIENYNKKDKQ